MTSKRLKLVALALIGLASANGIAQDTAPTSFPPEQVSRGSALYKTHCEQCHGVRMIGPPWAIDLATFPRDNPARFVDSVANGVRNMPPWGDLLKPDEIQALWAYVVAGEPKK